MENWRMELIVGGKTPKTYLPMSSLSPLLFITAMMQTTYLENVQELQIFKIAGKD